MSRDKEWFQLPRGLAAGRLVEIRNELRAKNLHDTEDPPFAQNPAAIPATWVSNSGRGIACRLLKISTS